MANTDTTVYAIVHRTVNEWEVGLGTWNTGNTLTRTTVIRSSNSNAVVTLSAGTKDIFMTFTPSVRQPGMSFTGALTPATNDLAALGSGSLSWADLWLATGGQLIWNNGAVTLAHSTDLLSITGGSFSTAAGTTTFPQMSLVVGTLMTTPSDGAVEMDATNMYGTTDVGNRGYIPLVHYIRADTTRTFTSNTSSQTIFNSPANGRITLETGTYRFQAHLQFAAMSATSGNRSINILGAGTATIGTVAWIAVGMDSDGTPGAGSVGFNAAVGSPASVVTAAIATGLGVLLNGSFEVTVAGTMIPSTAMVTAAASTLTPGSYWEIWRTGTTSVVSVGQWD
jgi:hypothetical protein